MAMNDITPVLWLLVFHGLVGGADVILNHELRDRLPQQRWARSEEALHSARELLFAILFAGLAWLQWTGAFAWIVAAVVLCEFSVSLCDTLLEDRIRRLHPLERGLHVVLYVNLGAYSALLSLALTDWSAQPAGVQVAPHGAPSWILSFLALLAVGWSIRDALAFHRLGGPEHVPAA